MKSIGGFTQISGKGLNEREKDRIKVGRNTFSGSKSRSNGSARVALPVDFGQERVVLAFH